MILQELVRHYEVLAQQGKVSRPGWCQAKISYALEIDETGNLLGIISEKELVMRGKKEVMAPKPLEVPEMVARSSGVAANFLCDNSKYILGIDADGANSQTVQRFEAARELHLEILKTVDNVTSCAVKHFFQTWDPKQSKEDSRLMEKWEDITAGGNLVFYVKGQYAQDDEQVRKAWRDYREKEAGGERGRCLVTGEYTEIARTHTAIKGVQGAQSSGAMLVSFNAPAFESYGRAQSYNAPVGKYAMFAYTTALNYLLEQRKYVFAFGDTVIVFWAESGKESYQKTFLSLMDPPKDNQKEIRRFFENLTLKRSIKLDDFELNPEQRFYILGLSPNAARLSVRFFYQNSFGKILSNIKKHYDEMEIVRPVWDEREYLGMWSLLMETVNQNSKDKKPLPNMTGALFEAVLSGERYPDNLYSNTLIRIRAEQGNVTRGCAAIVKAYSERNFKNEHMKEENFVALNEMCKEVAYVLGREFAVLEAIQEEANPGINTTIKDRYFNSACATPAMVFPILFKLKENHIRKIEKRRKYYEIQLTELQGKIEVADQKTPYPHRLSLEEQGMFILGYYHQVQKRYEKKEDK